MNIVNPFIGGTYTRVMMQALPNAKPGTNFKQLNFQTKNAFDPWYKDPAFIMIGWAVDVVNPFENQVPLIPWL